MPESNALLSPADLHRRIKKFGPTFQANHRKAGDFPIPHVVIGTRIFYRESDVTAFMAGQQQAKAASAPAGAPPEALTPGVDALARTLARIIKTSAGSEEVRTRITELLGGADDAA